MYGGREIVPTADATDEVYDLQYANAVEWLVASGPGAGTALWLTASEVRLQTTSIAVQKNASISLAQTSATAAERDAATDGTHDSTQI